MPDISMQLIEQVQTAINDNSPLTIQGNNTKANLGRTCPPTNNILSVSEHSGIVKYEPGELVMTARAGTTLTEIDAALAEKGQILACDPRRYQGQATLGGSLATHQSGPARPWLGSLRDHVLGVRLINGRGEHLRFGGQVMKNVAGYDVSRLQAGAMGTLGVITEVSLKVLPKPDATQTLIKHTTPDKAQALIAKLAGSTKPLTGTTWVDNKLYVRLQGSAQAVRATTSQWQNDYGMEVSETDKAEGFWEQLREHQLAFYTENAEAALWRFSVKPNAPYFLGGHPWLINWNGAQRWLTGDFELEALQQHAEQAGGEVCLYEGGEPEQERMLMSNPVLRRIQQNVKTSLDPTGIFNPGRLFSWL